MTYLIHAIISKGDFMNAIKLGKFIASARNDKHLTQDELAEKLGYDNSKKISRWECGNSLPDFDELIKISEILDVTLYELSICKRIKDKNILDATKDKLKTLKDYKKMTLHKRVLILIAILFGILFGSTTLYTIENYNTVEIYKLESLDENFQITGNFIKTKNHKIFNVTKLGYLKDYNEKENIDVHKIQFSILQNNKRLLTTAYSEPNEKNKDDIKLLDAINTASFSDIIDESNKITLSNLIFEIAYITNSNKKESISFEFKLNKIYANNFRGI